MGKEDSQSETELIEQWPSEPPPAQGRDVPTATELVGGTSQGLLTAISLICHRVHASLYESPMDGCFHPSFTLSVAFRGQNGISLEKQIQVAFSRGPLPRPHGPTSIPSH